MAPEDSPSEADPLDDSEADQSDDSKADWPDDPEADLRPDDPSDGLLPDDPAEGLVPDVSPDSAPVTSDADSELQKQFWTVVLLANVALLGLSLGAMLVLFEGRWTLGGAIFGVGAVALARGWLNYREATAGSSTDTDPEVDD